MLFLSEQMRCSHPGGADRNITVKMAADWRRGQEVVRGHLPWVMRMNSSQQQETIKMDISFFHFHCTF